MSVRLLGQVDGRVSHAMRAIRKLAALGFKEGDIPELVELYKAGLDKTRGDAPGRSDSTDPGKTGRRQLAEWAIRKMLAMGFTEKEIAARAGLNPATLAHLLNPFDERAIAHETALKLRDLAHTVGAERLSLFVQRMDITVLDTCCDKGRSLDASTTPAIASALRSLLLNALVLSSVPVSGVPGIHAFLAQIGHADNFVFLFGALPAATLNADAAAESGLDCEKASTDSSESKRLERLKLVEHEAEHLVQRFREERLRVEGKLHSKRHIDDPNDGNIA